MHFLWRLNIAHDLSLIQMKSPPAPKAKQKLHPALVMLRSSNSPAWLIYRCISWKTSCSETSHNAHTCGKWLTLCLYVLGCFREASTSGWTSFVALCSVSQSRLSLPAASRHAPIAPDCLIGAFQVRGPTSQDRAPRRWYTCSAAAGVAVLFSCTILEALVKEQE